MLHPETGEELIRDIRPITITYKGLTVTFPMPGWYGKEDSLHTIKDMEISDDYLLQLKDRYDDF